MSVNLCVCDEFWYCVHLLQTHLSNCCSHSVSQIWVDTSRVLTSRRASYKASRGDERSCCDRSRCCRGGCYPRYCQQAIALYHSTSRSDHSLPLQLSQFNSLTTFAMSSAFSGYSRARCPQISQAASR